MGNLRMMINVAMIGFIPGLVHRISLHLSGETDETRNTSVITSSVTLRFDR
jgi:hypothetical protein